MNRDIANYLDIIVYPHISFWSTHPLRSLNRILPHHTHTAVIIFVPRRASPHGSAAPVIWTRNGRWAVCIFIYIEPMAWCIYGVGGQRRVFASSPVPVENSAMNHLSNINTHTYTLWNPRQQNPTAHISALKSARYFWRRVRPTWI